MGRMHSKGKGLSRSSLPYKRSPASWVKITDAEVGHGSCEFDFPCEGYLRMADDCKRLSSWQTTKRNNREEQLKWTF